MCMWMVSVGVFFSSRRRHTRCSRDWSSDVCSSDLAGFIVGAVERKNLLTGKNVQPGDTLIALPSAGLHTNGYSLARKLVFEVAKLKPDTYVAEVGNKIGAELLKPHLCYAPALKNIVARGC